MRRCRAAPARAPVLHRSTSVRIDIAYDGRSSGSAWRGGRAMICDSLNR
jgi:hypothetical protein